MDFIGLVFGNQLFVYGDSAKKEITARGESFLHIREMEMRDIPAAERICLLTASANLRKDAAARENTLWLYNRYYTRACLADCFVAVNEADEAVGYILCAPDYKTYCESFRKNECKDIRKLGFLRGVRAYFEPKLQKKYAKRYPAHLHIDLLPEAQGQGMGTALMDALKSHLRAENVSGVFLCVGRDNKKALRFYKKQGFQVLNIVGGAVLMGCAL